MADIAEDPVPAEASSASARSRTATPTGSWGRRSTYSSTSSGARAPGIRSRPARWHPQRGSVPCHRGSQFRSRRFLAALQRQDRVKSRSVQAASLRSADAATPRRLLLLSTARTPSPSSLPRPRRACGRDRGLIERPYRRRHRQAAFGPLPRQSTNGLTMAATHAA